MALAKCKECGEQVSTKANTCPSCGAKAPKKTSLVTWIVLIIIVFVAYSISQSPSTSSYSSSRPSSSNSSSSSTERTPPPKPKWNHFTSKDEMSGKISAYASSPRVAPNSRMEFPYTNTQAWIAVGCDSGSEWSYFGFTNAPNLNNTDTQDGYDGFRTRVRWDDTIQTTSLTQKWGAKFIRFRYGAEAIAKIAGSESVMLELDWHGQRPVHFEFTLNGSSRAIEDIRAICRK